MRLRFDRRPIVAAVILVVGLGGGATQARAADREHQQLMADLRMLQEQTQQLQLSLNALTEALKLVSGRLDEQAAITRKAFADQKVLIDSLSGDVRIVREKLDETNVRLSSLSQEIEALQLTVAAPPALPPLPSSPDNALEAPPGGMPVEAPAPAPPSVAGLSPQRLYNTAYADFGSGQWTLAIEGFEAYIKTFPRTEQADDAQLYIGESYMLDGKFEQAVTAYDKVVTNYPTGDAAALAYYKRGLALVRLGDAERARTSWQTVIEKFPDSDASRLAKQSLDRLARPNR
jgi:tol-pal system protein YbgF